MSFFKPLFGSQIDKAESWILITNKKDKLSIHWSLRKEENHQDLEIKFAKWAKQFHRHYICIYWTFWWYYFWISIFIQDLNRTKSQIDMIASNNGLGENNALIISTYSLSNSYLRDALASKNLKFEAHKCFNACILL